MNEKIIKNAALYARFSSSLQRETSIEAQRRAVEKYAEKNGYVITQEYIDRACTGTKLDGRPQMEQLIEDSNKGLFSVVLVHKMDRFARNIRDSKNIRYTLQKNGVEVISVTERFEDNASGHLLGNISASIAEFYSENLGTEVIKGMKERAYKGLHTGGIPPLGYDVDITTKKLIINESEAQAVRRIFELYNSHASLTEIADTLNSEGYMTKTGRKFSKNSLHDIICNKKYCGYYVYNRRAPENDGRGNSHKNKKSEDIVEAKGVVPSIISEEDYNKAMSIMNGRKAKSGANSAKRCYLLSGHVKCGHCGCNMTGDAHHNGKKTVTVSYSCEKRKKKNGCPNMNIRQDKLDSLVVDKIGEYIFQDENIPLIAEKLIALDSKRNAEYQNCIKRINERIQSNHIKRENVANAIANGGDCQTLIDKLTSLEDEKAVLEKSLETAKAKFLNVNITEQTVKELKGKFKVYMLSHNTVAVRALIDKFVVGITENDNKIEIVLNI